MKRILLFFVLLAALAACSKKETLYDKARGQLPDSVRKVMIEELGGADNMAITDLEAIYSCDSLVIFQFNAATTNLKGEKLDASLRYIFLIDRFMTMAQGRTVYCEGVFGADRLDKKGIAAFKKKMDDQGENGYSYFLGITSPLL